MSYPARPLAQELWELSSRRAYTLTRLALALVGCGGLLGRVVVTHTGYQATKSGRTLKTAEFNCPQPLP